MVREILKLKTDNGLGEANPTFKDIELSEYNYKSTRMGMPDFTATLMWPTHLDDEWTGREYVDFLGERHYIKDTPTSEKNNTDARIKHSLVFVSESASILGNVYFYDTVYNQSLTKDRVCSNSTKFTFYGTLFEVCDRINCSLRYRGIGDSILNTKTNLSTLDNPAGDGFCVMVDAAYTDDKTSWEFSAEDVSLWEIISNTYNTTEIPFERRGKKIIFGATPKVVSQTFRQGPNKELLSITHNNANAKKINRITMIGASENIPHYYPNQTEYGNITVDATGNSLLTASKITIVNHSQFLAYIPKDKRAVLGKRDPYSQEIDITGISTSFYNGEYENYALTLVLPHNYEPGAGERIPWNIKIGFSITQKTNYILSDLTGRIWTQDTAGDGESYSQSMIQGVMGLALRKGDKSYPVEKTESGIDLGVLDIGDYTLSFYIEIPNSSVLHITGSTAEKGINSFCFIDWIRICAKDTVSDENGYYWAIGSKEYKTGQLGLSINTPLTEDMIGESIGWKVTERLPFQTNLMPPIYRSSNGEERFYEAIDNKYTDPDTGEKYIFPNPFVATHPCEHIYEDEKTKPTIKGITNSAGQLFGKIAAVAFDDNDNDSFKAELTEDSDQKDALKYEHSFFYVKLNKFDGTYGFNLFPHASQTGPMTIQMTSGKCNGCKFKIQVVETESSSGLKSVSNPVQTKDMNGDIVDGDYTEKVSKTNFQFWQQDTEEYSVWLCLQKDAETFGQILPSKVNGYVPEAGDTFNIINIDLPQAYIDAAEKRLEEDGIRYMFDHNEEKFNFNINASRIFFAENPDILNELDEYCKLKIEYDGETYEQYVESLTISCVNAEPLPSVKIDLAEEITVGKNFVDSVAERASSLIANPTTLGGGFAVSRGGLNVALADTRYLNKQMADRSPYKIASDKGFESGNFVSGSQGGYFGINNEDGTSFIEVDRLRVRMKALFEEIEVAKLQSIGGEMGISPGGSVRISFVETLDDVYRCYFKGKDDDKGAECRFVVNDQVQCKETNIMAGKTQNATNRFYWRLVTAVNNDMSYFELSKNICSNVDDDIPMPGDTVMQLGNQSDVTRQSAIVLSTNNIYAPNITLYNGIDSFTLQNKEVVQYGVDKTKNPPEPFFNCYGSFYFGPKDETYYLKYDASTGDLVFNGKLTVQSKIGDKTLETYINDAAQSAANAAKEELQAQIDGVIEAFNGEGAPTLNNYPANEWTTDAERKRHNKDVYTDITPYVDDVTTPTSGQSWRWYYNSPTDYGWTKIADSDAVRALQLAQMSVTDADVLYISHTSQTEAPALPTLNNQGNITNLNGWQTTAPAWSSTKYIWQTTYIKKGDGTATFSPPTCISGKNGVDGVNGTSVTITSNEVRYSTEHGATQPADSTFTLTAVPALSAGQYLWSRTRVTYSNGQSTTSYAVSRIGANGTNGTNGTSITITSNSVTYAKTVTATQPNDSAFTYNSIGEANVKAGDYLWTKTEVHYSDGTSIKSYMVSRIGSDGSDGTPGTPGTNGKTTYVHYAYANSADGETDFSTTYFADALYVGICTNYTVSDPTTPSSYEWARLRGEDGASAKIVVVNSDAAAFLYDENFSSLVGPQSINLTATLQGTSGYQWSYKRPGQSSFTNISGATSSAYSLAHNATIWGSGTTYKSITIRCTSGGMYDEVTIVKVSSGTSGTDGADGYTVLLTNESHLFEGDDEKAVAGTTECGVVAYKGNIQIATTIGTISGMPVGMSVAVNNNGTTSAKFTVTVRTTLTTRQGVLDVPVTVDGHIFVLKFSWALSLKGKDGRGIVSVVEMYAVNNSNTNEPADTDFSTAVPVTSETHRYLWNYEKTTYTDNTHEDTDKRVIGVHGANGVDGAGISSIVNYYLASSQKNGITINTPGWTTDATTEGAVTTDEKPYLWNYEKVYYTKGSPTTTTPHIIGIQGRGIKFIVEYYYLSTSNTTLQGGSWSETKQPWVAGRYYWTKSIITYTDGSTVETEPICVTGERGSDGVSAYLLNIKNNTAGVIANANGTVTGAYPSPQAEVWCGSQKLTTGITYSISVASGRATATINASGLVSLSGLLTDTATMTVTATINGVALQSTISVFKVKPGYDGTPATTYEIEPSQTVITKSMKNELSVTSLTCTVYKTTGDAARITSNEHTLKYTRLPDGANGTLSRTNGVSASVTVTDTTTSVIFELYNGTTLLDKETAYVVQDATDIELGMVNLLRETARILEHTDIWHKSVRVYTDIVDYYQGAQANRMSETFSPVQVYEDAIPNEYYTFSAWVKVTEAAPRGAYIKLFQPVEPFYPYTGLNSQAVNIKSHIILGEWVRVHGIFKAPDDGKLCVGLQIAKGAADSEVWIAGFKLEKGTLASSWSLNPDDTLKFNYLAAALEEDTTIEGGLIQTSLISLGRGGVMYAGSNGYYKDGTTPAFWAGGNMVDAAADGVTAADRPANFMVRMDGTGYASGNTIAFEKDKVRVGKDVIMDKDGFSITNDNAVDILQLSNKDIGTIDDITKSNTIMRRINGSKYNLSVNYGPEGFGLLFKDTIANTTSPYEQWQVGTVTKSETKFGMSLAFTLNLSNIDFNIPTSPWALYAYPNLKVQLMRSVSGNMVEEHSTSFPIKPTAHGSDVTIYADINYTIKTTGTYYLRLTFDRTSTTSTNVADSTAYMPNTIVTLYTRTGKQTLMGNNGFATAWTNTLFYINENQVVLRAGSFSFRIHKNNGFGYNTDGSETYKPLNWS